MIQTGCLRKWHDESDSDQTGGRCWLSIPACTLGYRIPASHTGPFRLQERLEGNHSAMSSTFLLLRRFFSVSLYAGDPGETPNPSSQLTAATQAWRYWNANTAVQLQVRRPISLSTPEKLRPWCSWFSLAQWSPAVADPCEPLDGLEPSQGLGRDGRVSPLQGVTPVKGGGDPGRWGVKCLHCGSLRTLCQCASVFAGQCVPAASRETAGWTFLREISFPCPTEAPQSCCKESNEGD